jgi:hypothetical protein
MEMHPRRQWRKTLKARGRFPPWQAGQPGGGAGQPHQAGSHALPQRGVLWYPLEHSCVVARNYSTISFEFRSFLAVFCMNPTKNINSSKLIETVSLNLLFYDIHPF